MIQFILFISSTPSGVKVYQNGELTETEINLDKDPLSNELSGIVVGGNWFGRFYQLAVYSTLVDGKVLYKSSEFYLDSINQKIPNLKIRCQLKEKNPITKSKRSWAIRALPGI